MVKGEQDLVKVVYPLLNFVHHPFLFRLLSLIYQVAKIESLFYFLETLEYRFPDPFLEVSFLIRVSSQQVRLLHLGIGERFIVFI